MLCSLRGISYFVIHDTAHDIMHATGSFVILNGKNQGELRRWLLTLGHGPDGNLYSTFSTCPIWKTTTEISFHFSLWGSQSPFCRCPTILTIILAVFFLGLEMVGDLISPSCQVSHAAPGGTVQFSLPRPHPEAICTESIGNSRPNMISGGVPCFPHSNVYCRVYLMSSHDRRQPPYSPARRSWIFSNVEAVLDRLSLRSDRCFCLVSCSGVIC